MSGHNIVQDSSNSSSDQGTEASPKVETGEGEFSFTGTHIRFGDSRIRKVDLALILIGLHILYGVVE